MSIDMQKSQVSPAFRAAPALAGYAVARVNLLPPAILAERRLRRTKAGLGVAVLAVAGAVTAGYLVAAASAASAEDELAAAQADTTRLTAEQGKYAEVPLVIGQVEAAQSARATAMTTDVLWHEYLTHLSASYPKDVWVRDLTATIAPADPAAVATGTASPGIGTVVVNGTGKVHTGVADLLDVLEATPGLSTPMYTEATRTDVDGTVVVDFTSEADITPDALSNRYEIKAS